MRHWPVTGLVALFWACAAPAGAGPLLLSEPAVLVAPEDFVVTGEATTRPVGHYMFCRERPDECVANAEVVRSITLTEALLAQLVEVNARINRSIKPITDLQYYSVSEWWAYPITSGDCEDFVLAKRRELHAAGWPLSTLLIAVVRQRSGAAHAVLMVPTDHGDLVLDNLDDDVRLWTETPYRFLKRQSQAHAGEWVAIADDRGPELVASH